MCAVAPIRYVRYTRGVMRRALPLSLLLSAALSLLPSCGTSSPDGEPAQGAAGAAGPGQGGGAGAPGGSAGANAGASGANSGGTAGSSGGAGAPSCEVVPPTACPDPAPTYGEVAVIFDQRCSVCHDGSPMGPWPLKDYSHISDWQNEIRGALIDCSMPPPDSEWTMSAEERLQILTWIRCDLPK
jgi:hypothetical protein